MTILEKFTLDLQYYLCKNNLPGYTIIRKHSKNLEKSGDVSFPLSLKNWYQLIKQTGSNENIFDYNCPNENLEDYIKNLKDFSRNWSIEIEKIAVKEAHVNVFLLRSSSLYRTVFHEILISNNYGCSNCFISAIKIETIPDTTEDMQKDNIDLTLLRLLLLKNISQNLVNCVTELKNESTLVVNLSLNSHSNEVILCGPVQNELGQKNNVSASELYNKRASDMRMMAQHKYGIQIKSDSSWKTYFETLGHASVTIEMLSNKPRKPIKITLNDLQSTHKGASFIFYNCARLSALFKEFNKRVESQLYPELPNLENVDFSLLIQPEEWELFYVNILQYPIVIKSCISDVEKGIINPQNLIIFLSNLSSVFSTYYRRIKILIDPREHLFPTLYARIYLLKSIQYVFHHALSLLDIQPIKEM